MVGTPGLRLAAHRCADVLRPRGLKRLSALTLSSHGSTGAELCQACCRDSRVKPSLCLLV